jgi:predicted MPP superfamily phosphohydrolase
VKLTRRAKNIVIITLIGVLLAIAVLFVFNTSLSVSYYDIETDKIGNKIKLVLITDLHSCDYGEGQSERESTKLIPRMFNHPEIVVINVR